jgi:hypothetical protein
MLEDDASTKSWLDPECRDGEEKGSLGLKGSDR